MSNAQEEAQDAQGAPNAQLLGPAVNAAGADTTSEHGSENGSENGSDNADEDLGDLGGEADDGDDTNPHKFIEKSLHYQYILMGKKHADESVALITEFAKEMPNNKFPKKKLQTAKKVAVRADERVSKFKVDYAAKRKEMSTKRTARLAKAKEARDKEEEIRKPLKSAISKDLKKKQALAEKAAMEAVNALGDSPDKTAAMAVGLAAFSKSYMEALAEAPIDAADAAGTTDASEPEETTVESIVNSAGLGNVAPRG